MPAFEVTTPDGKSFEVNVPEGATEQDAIAYIASTYKPEAPDEGGSLVDLPVGFAKGAVQGVRFIADAFGADNPVSKTLKEAEGYLGKLMSAQSQKDAEKISEILSEAEDKGVYDQVMAGVKALSVAPVDLIVQAFGTSAPMLVGGLLGAGLRTATLIGGGMGAGVTKDAIYQATKDELKKNGLSEEESEQRAQLAQEYGGKNLDQILLGTGLGLLSGSTGIEKALLPNAIKNITEKAVKKSAIANMGKVAVGEAFPEFLQGGQEQVAQNVALQREGFDTPTFRGALSSGTLEGLVGFGLGAGIGAVSPRGTQAAPEQEAPFVPPPPSTQLESTPEEDALAVQQFVDQRYPAAPPIPAPVPPAPVSPADTRLQKQQQATRQFDGLYSPVQDAGQQRAPIPALQPLSDTNIPFPRIQAPSSGLTQDSFDARTPEENRILQQQQAASQFGLDKPIGAPAQAQPEARPMAPVSESQVPARQPLNLTEQDRQAASLRVEQLGRQLDQATTDFDRQNIRTQIDQALGVVEPTPQPKFVDLRPMSIQQATNRLDAIRGEISDSGGNALNLNVVPHPSVPNAFAIEQRGLDFDLDLPSAPPISGREAQQRIEANAMAGQLAQRGGEEEARQVIISRALQSIQERGGVASPAEAQIVREANLGQPYDRIDYGLAPQDTEYQRLSRETGIELTTGPRENVSGPARRERDDLNDLIADTNRPAPLPNPARVIDALKTPSFARTADQVSTLSIANSRYSPSDMVVMGKSAANEPMTDDEVRRLDTIEQKGGRFDLSDNFSPEATAAVDDIRKKLLPALKRLGLGNVGLKLVDSINNGDANGFYLKQLITIALDSDSPMGVMRHESVHALKKLGAFTDAEWKVLSKRAKEEWIDRFIGKNLTQRYKDVYSDQNDGDMSGFDEYIQEEAIAEAFRYFTEQKPPSGMIQNIMSRLNKMFAAIRDFFAGKGLTSEDIFLTNAIFGSIESGRLTPGRNAQRGNAAPAFSLRDNLKENNREYKLDLDREIRQMGKRARLSEKEKDAIAKDAAKLGLTEDKISSIIDTIKNDKKRFPLSAGWAPIEVTGISFKEDENKNPIPDTESPKYKTIPYGYATPPNATKAPQKIDEAWIAEVEKKFTSTVEDIFKRAEAGDKNAKNIVAHQYWYKNVAKSLRTEYGAFGDLVADLLGATSPNTPVDTNWRFSIEIFRRFIDGDFDKEMRAFVKHLDAGKPPSSYPAQQKIRQISGKLYGMNSTNAMLALGDVWRKIKPGQAPKARNFALNLIGQSNIATIDVWAARMLRRVANMAKAGKFKRIPTVAESAVTGAWNSTGTAITGEFGFGAEVMRRTSERLRAKGIDISPPDLQAIAWFAEKEIWGTKNWTSKVGEGGSFEESIENNPVERYIVGHSVQQGNVAPSVKSIFDAKKDFEKSINESRGVVAFKMKETKGLYGGTVEEAFDTEVVVEKDVFDPTQMVSSLARTSQKEGQYDFFVSKIIGANDENANARPGVEIYFKNQIDLNKVMPILSEFTSRDVDGFTLALDPRVNDPSKSYVGVRLQYVPEISMRWDTDLREVLNSPEGLSNLMEGKRQLLNDIVAKIADIQDIAYSAVVDYDTVVVGKENYNDYISTETTERNISSGKAVWFGQPIRNHVETAVERYTGKRRGDGAGDVGDTGSQEQPRFSFRPDQFAFRPSDSGREGISFQPRQPAAKSFVGSHYGNAKVNTLAGNKYGSGLKGAERRRLDQSNDPRIQNRVYFYIPRFNDTMPPREVGVGNFVYSQKLDNILPPGPVMSDLFKRAQFDANAFESAIVDAGYDGYVNTDIGMMVVLNNDVPVQYEGTVAEINAKSSAPDKDSRYSLKPLKAEERRQLEADPFDAMQVKNHDAALAAFDTLPSSVKNKIDAAKIAGRKASSAVKDPTSGNSAERSLYTRTQNQARQALENHFGRELSANELSLYLSDFQANVDEALGVASSQERTKFSLRAPTTPEFKRFFKDSKVVDDAGKPLLMYHATTNFQGNEFKPSETVNRTGNPDGYYFTYDVEDANRYAGIGEGSEIIPVFLNIKNPYKYGQNVAPSQAMIDQFEKEMNKSFDLDRLGKDWYAEKLRTFKEGRFPNISFPTDAKKRVIQAGGYDGMKDGRDYVAFEPNQIKSAFNQNPTSSSDIRFSLRATETAPFKRWFGNSKILTPDGKPRVMYHGTARDITEFRAKQAGAIFVTDDPRFAENFAYASEEYMKKNAAEFITPKIEEKLRKKAKQIAKKERTDETDVYNELILDYMPTRANIMPVFVRAENPFDYNNPRHIEQLRESFGADDQIMQDLQMGDWSTIESEDVQAVIKDEGFDGFYVREGGRKNLALYSPNQIKSATGNSGTFSKDSDDIRYNLAESPNAPPQVLTKTTPRVTAGKAIVDTALETMSDFKDNSYWEGKRINWVDRYSGLTTSLKKLPIFQTDGTLRADMIKHAQSNVVNTVKTGIVSGVPFVANDGTIAIQPSENNLARSEFLADSLSTNKNVVEAGMTGKNYVAEIARALRGEDILNEDKARNDLGVRQLKEAKDLYAQIKKINATGGDLKLVKGYLRMIAKLRKEGYKNKKSNRERQVTPDQIRWAKEQLTKVPQVQEILDIWKSINNSLIDLWQETGLLTPESAAEYRENKNYVPLFKAREDLEDTINRYGVSLKSPASVKELKGSLAVRNIWENVDKQYASMLVAAYENQSRRIAFEQLQALGGAEESQFKTDQRVNLRFKRDGRDVNAIVDNPNVLTAFQTFSKELTPIMKFMGFGTQVLRAGALINPMFWIKQLIRDPIHATLTSNSGLVTPLHAGAEFLNVITKNSAEAKFLASRGVIGQIDSTVSLNDFLKNVGRDKLSDPSFVQRALHKLLEIHESSDAATRVSVFKKAKAKALRDGMSEDAAVEFAVYKAREVINFGVSGASPFLNSARQMIPFLNATIVGLDSLYKAASGYGLSDAERKETMRTFRTNASVFFTMSLAYALMMQSDDDYKELPDHVKDNNFLIPMGMGKEKSFIRLPIPYEVGFLFKTVPEVMVRYASGTSSGKEVIASYLGGLLHNLPTGGVPIPQAIRPALEVVTNFSFFTMRPIEGMGDIYKPVEMRGDRASQFAKILSGMGLSKLSLSPKQIDYLARGYFAELGTFATEMADYAIYAARGESPPPKNLEQQPFFRSFMTNPESSKAVSDFFEISGTAQQTVNGFNELKKTGSESDINKYVSDEKKAMTIAAAPTLRKIGSKMSDIKKAMAQIKVSDMPSDEKLRLNNELFIAYKTLAKQGVDIGDQLGIR